MYGTMARVPMRGVVERNVRNVILGLYTEEDTETNAQPPQPNWMGFVNRVLRLLGR